MKPLGHLRCWAESLPSPWGGGRSKATVEVPLTLVPPHQHQLPSVHSVKALSEMLPQQLSFSVNESFEADSQSASCCVQGGSFQLDTDGFLHLSPKPSAQEHWDLMWTFQHFSDFPE